MYNQEKIKESFAYNINVILENEKITQYEFAERVGYSIRSVTNWLSGKNFPSINIVLSICYEFNVSADWLLGIR